MNGIVKAEHQDAQAEAAPAGKQRTVFLYDGFGKVPPAKHAQQIQQVLGFLQLAVALHSGCQRSLLLHEVFKNMREPGDLIRFLRGVTPPSWEARCTNTENGRAVFCAST